MQYGVIAGNRSINAFIYHCFEHICEQDERRFVKKFREQRHDEDQVIHTFRELILGAHLSSSGFSTRYEYTVDASTPDWCILDDKSTVIGIVELVNFHIDKATESEIKKQLSARRIATVWRDGNKDNVNRLYHCIWDKAQVYGVLAQQLRIPYVVAVFCDFHAAIDFEEICLCLFDKEYGLLEKYPEVSGVLCFEEMCGRYSFKYAPNPNALQVIGLSSGVFPSDSA